VDTISPNRCQQRYEEWSSGIGLGKQIVIRSRRRSYKGNFATAWGSSNVVFDESAEGMTSRGDDSSKLIMMEKGSRKCRR